ncbi:MAG: DUF1997 domain-containing protein [Cyanobium sp.]
MILEKELHLQLPLEAGAQPIGQARIASYLGCPQRVLMDLLRNRRLKQLRPGLFRHVPRPIELGGFRLEPKVRLQAQWCAPSLQIHLVDYSLPGLEFLETRVRYGFQAEMIACEGGLALRANASLDVGEGGVGPLPQPLLRFLGERLLGLILDRLHQRCLRHLPPAIESWPGSDHGGSASPAAASPSDVQRCSLSSDGRSEA